MLAEKTLDMEHDDFVGKGDPNIDGSDNSQQMPFSRNDYSREVCVVEERRILQGQLAVRLALLQS